MDYQEDFKRDFNNALKNLAGMDIRARKFLSSFVW